MAPGLPYGGSFAVATVNGYLAWKQHLSPRAEGSDPVEVTRDLVALHATVATSPFLSLWARIRGFRREMLEQALYDRRDLVRVPCMRNTVHVVPSAEAFFFLGAYGPQSLPAAYRDLAGLLVRAGLCSDQGCGRLLERLMQQVPALLIKEGPLTVQEMARRLPELAAQVRHSAGKTYEGVFSIGSRLVPYLCAMGLLVRTRPRGTWRSTLYAYAALGDWLPPPARTVVTLETAQAWLVRRYVGAFGPVTPEDIAWWSGFTRAETARALAALAPDVAEVLLEGLGEGHLMLADDRDRLLASVPEPGSVCFLPALDPYIMGYADRRRFLAPEHQDKVLDRAGNALPTVWAGGRVVGAWDQRKSDGGVVYGLFEKVGSKCLAALEDERQRLDGFLGGESIGLRTSTAFTRGLG